MNKVIRSGVVVLSLGVIALTSACSAKDYKEAPASLTGSSIVNNTIALGGNDISTMETDKNALPKPLDSSHKREYKLEYDASTSLGNLEELFKPAAQDMFLLYGDALVRGNSTEINTWLEDKGLSYNATEDSLQSIMSSLADGVGYSFDVYALQKVIDNGAQEGKFDITSKKVEDRVYLTYSLSAIDSSDFGVDPEVTFIFREEDKKYVFSKFSSTCL